MNTALRSSSRRGVLLGCFVSCRQRGADPPIPGDHSVLPLTHYSSFDDRSWSHGQRHGHIRPLPTNLITVNFPDLALFIQVPGVVRSGSFLRVGRFPYPPFSPSPTRYVPEGSSQLDPDCLVVRYAPFENVQSPFDTAADGHTVCTGFLVTFPVSLCV